MHRPLWTQPALFVPEGLLTNELHLEVSCAVSSAMTYVQPWVKVSECLSGTWHRCETVPGGSLAELPDILAEVAADLGRWTLHRVPPFA